LSKWVLMLLKCVTRSWASAPRALVVFELLREEQRASLRTPLGTPLWASLGAHQGACQRSPIWAAGRRCPRARHGGVASGIVVDEAQRSGRRLRRVGQWRDARDAVQVLAAADVDARLGPFDQGHWRDPRFELAERVVVAMVEVGSQIVLRPVRLLLGALADGEGQHGAGWMRGADRRGRGGKSGETTTGFRTWHSGS